MTRKKPIKNTDTVLAYTDKGEIIKYNFGQLKNDFLHKRIKNRIVKIHRLHSTVCYFVKCNPTKGFSFERILEGETK